VHDYQLYSAANVHWDLRHPRFGDALSGICWLETDEREKMHSDVDTPALVINAGVLSNLIRKLVFKATSRLSNLNTW
jgi:hypothetical protein